MQIGEGRSPRPIRGDPNTKTVRLSLSAEEWRRLHLWAAEDASTVQAVVTEVVRRELADRPASTY